MSDTAKTAEIRHQLWEELNDSPYVMIGLGGSRQHSIPMNAVIDEDSDSALWFYTARDNRLAGGGEAMMQFASKGHDLFACVSGKLIEERDQSIIDKHWNNSVEAWYEEGRRDPKLVMLRFELDDAEIWEADPGVVGAFKMLTGMTMKPDDLGSHARINM